MASTPKIMKSSAAVLILLWTLTVTFTQATSRTIIDHSSLSIAEKHEEWMTSYGRTYEHHEEKAKRQQIFKHNLEFVETFNKLNANSSFRLSLNRFADLTNKEFVASHTGLTLFNPPTEQPITPFMSNNNVSSIADIEPSLDWRQKGAVNPIKKQAQCGSCWAFSAVAAIEAIIQIKTGKLLSLSEQQLVDCVINNGCSGHYADGAFKYIIQGHGLASESDYPYENKDGICNDKNVNPVGKISSYQDVPRGNEEELLKAVAMQPVSVAIDAKGQAFQFYSEGLFAGQCGTQLNHAVTIIGYGEEANGDKYWLIRNSWGQSWGEGGYMKILRGTGDINGLCGINLQASYPIY